MFAVQRSSVQYLSIATGRCFRSVQNWCDDQRTARLVKVLQIPSMVIPRYVNPG
ncbi:MAG: hypothetical protein ACYC4N_25375 [Pirellulaceae bacterium]